MSVMCQLYPSWLAELDKTSHKVTLPARSRARCNRARASTAASPRPRKAEPLSSATAPPLGRPCRASPADGGVSLVAEVIPKSHGPTRKVTAFFPSFPDYLRRRADNSHLARLRVRSMHCICARFRQRSLALLQLRIMRS
jgi:hypothetical protein